NRMRPCGGARANLPSSASRSKSGALPRLKAAFAASFCSRERCRRAKICSTIWISSRVTTPSALQSAPITANVVSMNRTCTCCSFLRTAARARYPSTKPSMAPTKNPELPRIQSPMSAHRMMSRNIRKRPRGRSRRYHESVVACRAGATADRARSSCRRALARRLSGKARRGGRRLACLDGDLAHLAIVLGVNEDHGVRAGRDGNAEPRSATERASVHDHVGGGNGVDVERALRGLWLARRGCRRRGCRLADAGELLCETRGGRFGLDSWRRHRRLKLCQPR